MIQKQQPLQKQAALQYLSTRQLILEILKIKHHEDLINYRLELIFNKNFPLSKNEDYTYWIKFVDAFAYSSDKQYINKYNKMGQIVLSIKQLIINRVKKDCIAPFLSCDQNQSNIIKKIQERYRNEGIHVPTNNTMHTESSTKNINCKQNKIQTNLLTIQKTSIKNGYNKIHDNSTQTLNKVTQDLSKMIQKVYHSKKKSHLNSKNFINRNYLNKIRESKKKLFTTNISKIQTTQSRANQGLYQMEYDQPDQNYGLKRIKKSNPKQIQFKSKQKIRINFEVEGKRKKIEVGQRRKIQQFQKLHYSPLTPKPTSLSKLRMGWGDNANKASRHSSKSFMQIPKRSHSHSKKLVKPPQIKSVGLGSKTKSQKSLKFPKKAGYQHFQFN